VFPQDAGSQLVPFLLDARPYHRVVDVCAAPGGKATVTSEMVPEGSVIALDRRPARVRLLRAIATRLSARNVHAVVGDGRRLPIRGEIERILLDVPCTSVGTLRRNPDLKWRVKPDDLALLAALQLELLRSASRLLSAGGRLVYATCSTEPEENEEVVERFLSQAPGFRRLEAASALPEAARALVDREGFFRTSPEENDMDGYFAAILTRDRIIA
jgi:16S rRNA (cytosine967-C5)-methyltransferase